MKTSAPLALALLLLAAGEARADEPVDARVAASTPSSSVYAVDGLRYPPPSTRFKVIGAGVGLEAALWGVGFAFASAFPEVPGTTELKIPVAGPWMMLAKSGCASDDPDCGAKKYIRGVFLVLDGFAQAAAIGLIVQGIVMKTEAPRVKSALTFRRGEVTMSPLPIVGPTLTGLGVGGTF
jgi:hypothetical protein